MKHALIITAAALALASCEPGDVTNTASNVAVVAGQVELRATTALSLAELAYNSAEAAATAALRSRHLSEGQVQQLADAMRAARAYRNEARALVAAGQDASATLESLSLTINSITLITTTSGGN
jgi:hypothetical protein